MINKIKLWKKFSILIFSVSFSLLSASDLGLGKEVKPFANQSIKNLRFDSDLRKIISEAKDDDLEILAKNNFDKTKLNETEEDELHAKEFCMKIENFAERRTYQLMRMIKQLNLISNDEYTDTFNIINKMIYEKSLKLYSFQIKKTFSNHDFSQAVTASMKLLKEKNIELENQIKIQHNFVSSSIRTSDGCEGIKNAYEENKNMIERLKKVEKNKSELIDQSYQDTLNTLAQYASRANTIENEARKKRFLTQKKFFPHEHAEIFLSHLELIKDNTRTITLLENTETPYDNNSANLLHNINFSIMKDQRLENLRKEYFCKVIETAKLILESYKKDSEVPQPFLCFNTLYKKILETSESQKKGNSGIIHNFAQKLSQQKLSPDCAADIYIEDWKLEKKFY